MTTNTFPNGYALIIGVGSDLPDTVQDAKALHKILIDAKKAGYPDAQVQLITEGGATKQGIIDALKKLKTQTQNNPDATVLIYYSGHGGQVIENGNAHYYLIPNDFDFNYKNTGLSKEEFSSLVNAIKAQKLMLIFDCCHAEGINEKAVMRPPNLKQNFEPLVTGLGAGGGRVVMASCKADEKSYIDKKRNHGIFTLALIEALEGKNTAGSKPYISFNDICQYLIEQVKIRAFQITSKLQTPVFNLTDFIGFDVCRNSYIPPKPSVFMISDKQDNNYLEAISNSLKVLETRGLIEKWDISRIPAGAIIKDVLNQQLDKANVVLGLVSTNYLNSDICLNLQNQAILNKKPFIPIILEDCLYELELDIANRELLPKKQGELVPVSDNLWTPKSAAYTEISRAILRQIQEMLKN